MEILSKPLENFIKNILMILAIKVRMKIIKQFFMKLLVFEHCKSCETKRKSKRLWNRCFPVNSETFFIEHAPVAASGILFKYLYLTVSIIIEILNWFCKYLSFAFAKNLFSLKRERVFYLSLNENHSVRSSHRCSIKKKRSKKFCKIHRKTLVPVSFLMKFQAWGMKERLY